MSSIRKLIRTKCSCFNEKEEILRKLGSILDAKTQDFYFSFPTNEIIIRVDIPAEKSKEFDVKVNKMFICTILSASRGK
jgi:hypothetical protein